MRVLVKFWKAFMSLSSAHVQRRLLTMFQRNKLKFKDLKYVKANEKRAKTNIDKQCNYHTIVGNEHSQLRNNQD